MQFADRFSVECQLSTRSLHRSIWKQNLICKDISSNSKKKGKDNIVDRKMQMVFVLIAWPLIEIFKNQRFVT